MLGVDLVDLFFFQVLFLGSAKLMTWTIGVKTNREWRWHLESRWMSFQRKYHFLAEKNRQSQNRQNITGLGNPKDSGREDWGTLGKIRGITVDSLG